MTQQRHRLRPTPPFQLSRPATASRVRPRGLRSLAMLGIVLILLIFTLQGGQTDAVMPGGQSTIDLTALTRQPLKTAYLANLAAQRARYQAWLKLLSTEMPPADNNITPPPNQVARGVTLSSEVLQTAAGTELVNMLNIDLTNPTVRLGVVQAYNRLISPAETLSSMANNSRAVAGINGDFFDIHNTNVPIGEEVINGHLLHSPNPQFYAVFGETSSGRFSIGPEYFSGNVTDGKASYLLYSINHYSEINNGRLVLLTPDLGEPDYIGGDPVAIIQPIDGSSTAFLVKSVYSGAAWLPALSGQDALVASGYSAYWLATTLHRGDRISVTERISPDGQLFQAIGGGPQVLMNGAPYYDPNQPVPREAYSLNPQTAVGVTKDGSHVLFAVFDGRLAGPLRSRGMTHAEVADFMLSHGIYNAMLFDSGGSTEMVARLPGQQAVSVINWPSGGFERPLANGLFVFSIHAVHAIAALRKWIVVPYY